MSNQLLLDSAYRDRNDYPLSTNYAINPKQLDQKCSCAAGCSTCYVNPIAIAYPNVHSGSDTSNVVVNCISFNTIKLNLPPDYLLGTLTANPLLFYFEQFFQNVFCNCTFLAKASASPGDYVSSVISKSIIDNSGTTLYLKDDLPVDVSRAWCIYKNTPYAQGVLEGPNTTNILDLCSNTIIPVKTPSCSYSTQSDSSGNVCGQYFIMITDTDAVCDVSNRGQVKQIKYYDNLNHRAYLYDSFHLAPSAGQSYEVYKAFKEGMGTLWYSNGIKDKNFTYCREVTLSYVVLPNFILGSGSGGRLDNYRYINLKISNDGINNSGSSTISTNSIDARYVTYVFPINIQLLEQRFFVLTPSTNKCFMIDFNQPIKVEFTLPNGDPIVFEGDDRWSTNYFPLFLSSSNINSEGTVVPDIGVVYPKYSPDTPVPFETFNLLQTGIFLDFIC
jgi:hypothetical protein